ncbi:MAG TPA: GNAT family N-acetyltransferase [Chitinophagales bacterium]|nr:GNAT family N-acetyltransferase [Chitinophagales bacterium]
MSDAKKIYRQLAWPDAPLFHQPWWLDAVAGDAWDVCMVKDGEEMKAYFLYAIKNDLQGFQIIMPMLTQFLGPNYKLKAQSARKRLNEETEMLEALLHQLPAAAFFESRWHFHFQNWLPFYWKGFLQTTRYTYFLPDISNPELLRENFSEKINREINKAEKQFSIEQASDVAAFYSLLVKNFSGKRMKIPFEKKLLQKIFDACCLREAGKIWLAKDAAGKIAAGIFIVKDAATAYYLIGGKDDDFGNSGAMSFLFWNCFRELSRESSAEKEGARSFDFEGSMIKGVENYFRSFGAEQKGFFEITKIKSALLKMKSSVKSFLNRG